MKKLLLLLILGILLIAPFISAFNWGDGSLQNYWDFTNTSLTKTPDVVTNIKNVTTMGSSIFRTGKVGNGIYFDGTNWANISSSYELINGTVQSYTINTWVNYTATNPLGFGSQFFAKDGTTSLGATMDGNSEIYYGGGLTSVAVPFAFDGSKWVMMTIVANSSCVDLYINGTKIKNCGTRGEIQSGHYVFGYNPLNSGGGKNNFTGVLDEFGIWNRSLTASEITELYNSGTGLTYGGGPGNLIVSLFYPTNKSLISNTTIQFNTSYSFIGMDIDNATYYVWYSNNSIFNKTTVDVLSSKNFSLLNISNFILGSYKWNAYGCGLNATDMICSWGKNGNYTFDIGGELLNENYSAITYETASEYFTSNFSLFPGTSVISVYLVYNGTSYVVSDITNYGNKTELKKTIDIPLNKNPYANETKSFYWSFIFSNSGLISQNTSLRNQTILPVNIVYCNTTYRQLGLNFTTYDETNPNPVINATFHTFWNFWLGGGTIKKNYSFEDTSNGNHSFKFCISPNQSIIHTDLSAEMESTNYWPRTYYLNNATINNATQEVPLRLINNTLGVKFFHTVSSSGITLSKAIVIISKFDVGIGLWVTVGIRQSDDTGKFIEYLELDKQYTYSISKDGTFLGSIEKTATCSASPCLIELDVGGGDVNLWNGYYDAFAPNVVYTLTYDKTTKNVTYTFVDTSGLATYFRLQVNKVSANQTGTLICNKTLYTTTGSIICELTGQTGQFIAKGYVARSPEKLVATLFGILSAIAEAIGKMDGLFFTLLIVVVVGLIGAFNPVVGILLGGLAFIFAGIMGFIMISVTAMILIFILVIILIIKMGRQGV